MTDASPQRSTLHPSRESVIGEGVVWIATWTLRLLILAAGAYALGYVVGLAWSILLPVVLALVLATVLQPPARWLERRTPVGAGLSSGAVILGFIGLLVVVVLFLVPTVGSQAGDIADSASKGLAKLQGQFAASDLVTQAQVDTAVGALQDRLQASASVIASGVLVGVGAITTALVNTLITLVLAFFFIKDGRRFLPWVRRLLGPSAGPHVATVAGQAWTTLASFVRTQALVGMIDAVLIGAGLAIVGVPLVVPLMVLTFVAAFAPVIGAITIGALAVLIALVSQGYVAALIVFAIVLAVQQLEGNVLLPLLQGRNLNLHAGVVLLSIVLGTTLFGVAGAFLSVPAVAVSAVILRYLNEVVAARAGEPRPTSGVDPDDTDDVAAAPGAAETTA